MFLQHELLIFTAFWLSVIVTDSRAGVSEIRLSLPILLNYFLF
jgi:hypothetical protein